MSSSIASDTWAEVSVYVLKRVILSNSSTLEILSKAHNRAEQGVWGYDDVMIDTSKKPKSIYL